MSTQTLTRTSTTIARVHVALERLDRGAGNELDISDVLCADPARTVAIVHQWDRPGPIVRFRELVAGPATFDDCVGFCAAEPAWMVALFLALDGERGQQVAAQGVSRPMSRPRR